MGAAAMTDFSETRGGWSNDPGRIKSNIMNGGVRALATELADQNWGGFVWWGITEPWIYCLCAMEITIPASAVQPISIYIVDGKSLLVIALMNFHREPNYWKSRR